MRPGCAAQVSGPGWHRRSVPREWTSGTADKWTSGLPGQWTRCLACLWTSGLADWRASRRRAGRCRRRRRSRSGRPREGRGWRCRRGRRGRSKAGAPAAGEGLAVELCCKKATHIRPMLAICRCRAESRSVTPVIRFALCFVLAEGAGTDLALFLGSVEPLARLVGADIPYWSAGWMAVPLRRADPRCLKWRWHHRVPGLRPAM